jgi:excisionase family DNA binding protein
MALFKGSSFAKEDENEFVQEIIRRIRIVERMLNSAEIADMLGMSVSTIRKWVHYGFIPHVKLGRAVRFREKDVEAWIEERAETGRATLAPEIQWQ